MSDKHGLVFQTTQNLFDTEPYFSCSLATVLRKLTQIKRKYIRSVFFKSVFTCICKGISVNNFNTDQRLLNTEHDLIKQFHDKDSVDLIVL